MEITVNVNIFLAVSDLNIYFLNISSEGNKQNLGNLLTVTFHVVKPSTL